MGHKRHLIHLKAGSEAVTIFCSELAGLCGTLGAGANTHIVAYPLVYSEAEAAPQLLLLPSDLLLQLLQLLIRKGTSFYRRSHTQPITAGDLEALSECGLYIVLVGSFAFAGSTVSLLFPTLCPFFPSLTACLAGFRPQHHIPKKQPYTGRITSTQD